MRKEHTTIVRAALFYFGVVFGAGFVLGTIRVLWAVPRFGVRASELTELPLMILGTVLVARWTVLRFGISSGIRARLAVGIMALIPLLIAELLPIVVQGLTVLEYVESRDPVAFAAFLISLVLFGVMPLIAVHRDGGVDSPGLINNFIAEPEVAETYEILVHAPANTVFEVAERFDLHSIPLVRNIFRLRELVFRLPTSARQPKSLVSETTELGWRRLARLPGRQLVMGAVTQPWVGDVKFRGIAPGAFAGFDEPAFVKIVWTFESQPIDTTHTRFRTRTYVVATDREARLKFARYWVFAGPFTGLIRRLANRAIRAEAEASGTGVASQVHGTKRSLS